MKNREFIIFLLLVFFFACLIYPNLRGQAPLPTLVDQLDQPHGFPQSPLVTKYYKAQGASIRQQSRRSAESWATTPLTYDQKLLISRENLMETIPGFKYWYAMDTFSYITKTHWFVHQVSASGFLVAQDTSNLRKSLHTQFYLPAVSKVYTDSVNAGRLSPVVYEKKFFTARVTLEAVAPEMKGKRYTNELHLRPLFQYKSTAVYQVLRPSEGVFNFGGRLYVDKEAKYMLYTYSQPVKQGEPSLVEFQLHFGDPEKVEWEPLLNVYTRWYEQLEEESKKK